MAKIFLINNFIMFLIFVFFDCCIFLLLLFFVCFFIFRVISIVLIFYYCKQQGAIVQEVGNDVYRSNSPILSKGVCKYPKKYIFVFCFFSVSLKLTHHKRAQGRITNPTFCGYVFLVLEYLAVGFLFLVFNLFFPCCLCFAIAKCCPPRKTNGSKGISDQNYKP